ncbi:MAG: hypothetical protein KA535_10770 [Azonexus sp.]|nr:hypothetical protein [Azonexus sp.]
MRYITLLAGIAIASPGIAQQHDPSMHSQHMAAAAAPAGMAAKDTRQLVRFPAEMREHTLANMRDHLLALQEIQSALAKSEYDRAAETAEKRLGMSSLALHGAHEVSKFMPKGMQDAGTAMHRSASRFGVTARDAAVTGDVRPALGALSEVMGACVACHSGYRLK